MAIKRYYAPMCPYCEYQQLIPNGTTFGQGAGRDVTTIQCPKCKKVYIVYRHVVVKYSTDILNK